MTSPLPLLPTSDHAAVWRCVPTTDPVAFIVVDDGYRPAEGDPEGAAQFVESFTPKLPLTPFLTFYAATMGEFPPLSAAAAAHVAYIKRFLGAGRRVQCHDSHHLDLTGVQNGGPALTYDQQYNEIRKGRDFLARSDVFGPPASTLFRPPYGRWNDDTRRAAYAAGFKVAVLWTHTYAEFATKPVRPGDILLCHWEANLEEQLRAAKTAIDAGGLTPAYIEDYVR